MQAGKLMIRRQTVRSEMTQGYTDAEPFSRYGVKSNINCRLDGGSFSDPLAYRAGVSDNIHPGCMRGILWKSLLKSMVKPVKPNPGSV